jgi:tRNA-splicing ligase RtcB
MYQVIDGIPVWGEPIPNAIKQLSVCVNKAKDMGVFVGAALTADHHPGYSCPIGGVLALRGAISPSVTGFDQACGNKAVLTDAKLSDIRDNISTIMDDIFKNISFGIGRKNNDGIDHSVFDNPSWNIPVCAELKEMAREQLTTVGSGNHYVDIFHDELERIWIGVHFGSRGLGHKLATHFIKAGGGKDGIDVEPVILEEGTDLGRQYIDGMALCGEYAYAGRDLVCSKVANILGANILEEVHNHHNFAWEEWHPEFTKNDDYVWVGRKGATPAFPGQRGFVGGTMGENSVILEGVDSAESKLSLYSTVHGAGRVMSRTAAAGKSKWKNGVKTRVSEGLVSQEMMNDWVKTKAKVELRGAGVDESPHCYKRLDEVLDAHKETIKILHTLTPIGVAMCPDGVIDPFKD